MAMNTPRYELFLLDGHSRKLLNEYDSFWLSCIAARGTVCAVSGVRVGGVHGGNLVVRGTKGEDFVGVLS